jgi:hypothetical protein
MSTFNDIFLFHFNLDMYSICHSLFLNFRCTLEKDLCQNKVFQTTIVIYLLNVKWEMRNASSSFRCLSVLDSNNQRRDHFYWQLQPFDSNCASFTRCKANNSVLLIQSPCKLPMSSVPGELLHTVKILTVWLWLMYARQVAPPQLECMHKSI